MSAGSAVDEAVAPDATPVKRPSRGLRHFTGLDGIRGVAVIAVLLYHFDVSHVAGGFLGVDLFFVVSGYLITGQLMTRWVYGRSVTATSFRQFWSARARRLFPSLGVMLAVTTIVVVAADRAQLRLFRSDLAAAASYMSNWWYIFHQRSYFQAAGRPPLLQHLWSLAVEEQFYLVWPVVIAVVILLVRRGIARQTVVLVAAVALMLASAAVVGVGSAVSQAPQLADPSRWYFGTDSHAVGLLAGAALAARRGGDGLGSATAIPPRRATPAGTMVGFAVLAGILIVLSQVGEFNTGLYRAGFLGFSLLAAALVAVAVQRGPVQQLLGCAPLVAIGKRSYAMYLWHWPVAAMTRPGIDVAWPAGWVLVLRVAVTMVLAEASYRLVELPVRRMGWRAYWRQVTRWRLGRLPATTLAGLVAAGLVVAVCWPSHSDVRPQRSYAAGSTYVKCRTDTHGGTHLPTDAPKGARCANTRPNSTPPTHAKTKPQTSASPGSHRTASPTPTHPKSAVSAHGRPHSARQLASQDLVVYGDSVPLGAIPQLSNSFATVTNHAAEGAQASTVLPGMIRAGHAGELTDTIVLLHTGDNGVINTTQLRQALAAASKAQIVIVATPHVPKSWQDPNVAAIKKNVPKFSNTVLLDWDHDINRRDNQRWLNSDSVHLTPAGRLAYHRLVTHAAHSKT